MRVTVEVSKARSRASQAFSNLTFGAAERFGSDMTKMIEQRNLLVLSPHPDDETLACGALIARVVASGGRVDLVIVTDGRHAGRCDDPVVTVGIRRNEAVAAAHALGLPSEHLHFLGYEDGTLAAEGTSLVARLEGLLERFRPDVLFVTSAFDLHRDHAALGRAARTAVATTPVSTYEYLIWGWRAPRTFVCRLLGLRPPLRELGSWLAVGSVRTGAFMAAKRAALDCYQSQLSPSSCDLGLAVRDDRRFSRPGGPLTSDMLHFFLSSRELFFPFSGARDSRR